MTWDELMVKTALVTGAASGIGKAIAVLLAKQGAEVIVADISEAAGRDVAGLMSWSIMPVLPNAAIRRTLR